MTRFLSFVILLLHLLSDIRRRAALATTAAVVMAFAIVAVVGTIATSASAAPHGASQPTNTHIAQPEPRAVAAMPLTSRQQSRLPALRAAAVPKPADDAAEPSAAATSPVSPVSSASSAAQNTAPSQVLAGAVAQPAAPQVQLAVSQTQCQQGQWMFAVPSASLVLPKPAASDGTLSWYWETRTDSGTAPSQPPVGSTPSTQPFHAGDTSVSFAPAASGQPLLSAPVGTTYGYSFRLHVTAPFDVASDWVSVPASTAACSGVSTPAQQ